MHPGASEASGSFPGASGSIHPIGPGLGHTTKFCSSVGRVLGETGRKHVGCVEVGGCGGCGTLGTHIGWVTATPLSVQHFGLVYEVL